MIQNKALVLLCKYHFGGAWLELSAVKGLLVLVKKIELWVIQVQPQSWHLIIDPDEDGFVRNIA